MDAKFSWNATSYLGTSGPLQGLSEVNGETKPHHEEGTYFTEVTSESLVTGTKTLH